MERKKGDKNKDVVVRGRAGGRAAYGSGAVS